MQTDRPADPWYAQREAWTEEVAALRAVVLGLGLTETVKWRQPCYTDRDTNVLIISVRKDSAVVSFLRGALLKDPEGRLIQPGENSRSARYLRFTSVSQVRKERAYLEALVSGAVELARSGLRVPALPPEVVYVEDLQRRLDSDPGFREAFEALTPGRRRGYNLHFAQPKNSSTREARIDRCGERILLGKGLNDCVCGRSKRPPGCDGSHKS